MTCPGNFHGIPPPERIHVQHGIQTSQRLDLLLPIQPRQQLLLERVDGEAGLAKPVGTQLAGPAEAGAISSRTRNDSCTRRLLAITAAARSRRVGFARHLRVFAHVGVRGARRYQRLLEGRTGAG